MTMRVVLVTAFAALLLPAGALAKEPVKATVCGADGCARSEDKQAILPLMEGGPPASGLPKTGAPAYRVRVTIATEAGARPGRGKTETFTTWMSPALGLIRGSEGTWITLPAATLAALRHVAGGIRPFPAARLPLGGRLVAPEDGSPARQVHAPAHAPVPAASPGTTGTLLAAIGGGALAALAALVVLARRRRRRPPGRPAAVS
jgi:hypothetical protein